MTSRLGFLLGSCGTLVRGRTRFLTREKHWQGCWWPAGGSARCGRARGSGAAAAVVKDFRAKAAALGAMYAARAHNALVGARRVLGAAQH